MLRTTISDGWKRNQASPSLSQKSQSIVLKNRQFSTPVRFLGASRILSLAVLIGLCCQAPTLQAQISTWVNTSNTNAWFELDSNWNPSLTTDVAIFNAPGTYQVWWNSNTASSVPGVNSLKVFGGDVTFVNQDENLQHQFTIGAPNIDDFTVSGSLTVRGLHLRVQNGGFVTGASGILTLDGAHSAGTRMSALGSPFEVNSLGSVNVVSGAVFDSNHTLLRGGTGTVTGPNSQWNTANDLQIGDSTSLAVPQTFTMSVTSGGLVTSSMGFIGTGGGTGIMNLRDSGSRWNNTGEIAIGNFGGSGFSIGTGILNIENGAIVTSGSGTIGKTATSNGAVTVTGIGSRWNNSTTLTVGQSGDGTLTVQQGGVVASMIGVVNTGIATVRDAGSQWNNSHELNVGADPNPSTPQLNILQGGIVTSANSHIGRSAATRGEVTVAGPGSQFRSVSTLNVGTDGDGTLFVSSGGNVSSIDSYIAQGNLSRGTVTVTGAGSVWENQGNLTFGAGVGTLFVESGGSVISYGTTSIGTNASVILNGGRFEFGTMNLAGLNRISGTSGSLAGTINHSGYTNVASLTEFQGSSLDMTDVSLWNSGGLYGDASLGCSLVNRAGGVVQTVGSERMRFAGGGTNAGQMNIFGGQISFGMNVFNTSIGEINNFGNSMVAREIWNAAGGLIAGRGQFVAQNGWTNQGIMAFSGGITDLLGDVVNLSGGKIVTSGNATTTFYGDVVHNGSEIRTAAGSETVFFGAVSGAGPFTGTGTVFMEGDLRPGNSPNVVNFGGDLVFSDSATLMIELGGEGLGEFDQLLVNGDLFLDNSQLVVSLWDGFQLGSGMSFLFADVGGTLTGQFAGLSEGALVGNFGGTDLFITYHGIGGNSGVSLFTAVPEPSSAVIVGAMGGLLLLRRRRS